MSSNSGYTIQAQLRYIALWFEEWSEMQRGDFLPILAQKFAPAGYVNGVVSGMEAASCQDRPPSLFQCRIKLFHEWFESWGVEEREQLIKRLRELDPGFVEKFEEEIRNVGGTEESELVRCDTEFEDSGNQVDCGDEVI